MIWGGGGARDHGAGLFAAGGAYWPLATVHSGPLWIRAWFGCVNRAPSHQSTMVVTLQSHSGIVNSMTGLNAAELRQRSPWMGP